MEPEKQSSKTDPRLWTALNVLMLFVTALTNYLNRQDPAEPRAPRNLEIEAERVAEKAAKQLAESPTTDRVELQLRDLRTRVDGVQKQCDLYGGILPLLWSETYEGTARYVQLEVRVRQSKNPSAPGEVWDSFELNAKHWRAMPATAEALQSLTKLTPLHKAADTTLRGRKLIVEH